MEIFDPGHAAHRARRDGEREHRARRPGWSCCRFGGIGRFAGKRRFTALIPAWTLLLGDVDVERQHELQHDHRDPPSPLVDFICRRPWIWPNWRSSGAVTAVEGDLRARPRVERDDLDRRIVDLLAARRPGAA